MSWHNKWTVVRCPACGNFRAFYTDGSTIKAAGYEDDDMLCGSCMLRYQERQEMMVCQEDCWSPEIFVTLMGNELEIRNMHSMKEFPERLQTQLEALPAKMQCAILQVVCDAFFEEGKR